MRFGIRKSSFPLSTPQFLRKAGYGFIRDIRSGSESWTLRLGSGDYPRIHLYVEEADDTVIFDLHLDQQKKSTSFSGSRHKGEYSGEVVEKEVARLKQLVIELLK